MFIAHDVFVAALCPDGTIISGDNLANIDSVPVVIAEFTFDGNEFLAAYHDNLDRWELFGYNDSHLVASPDDEMYKLAEKTVAQFNASLFSEGDSESRLVRRMTQGIRDEMDKDILADLKIAAGIPVPPPIIVIPTTTGPFRPRILKANWTVDSAKDVMAVYVNTNSIIGKSRLVNPPSI